MFAAARFQLLVAFVCMSAASGILVKSRSLAIPADKWSLLKLRKNVFATSCKEKINQWIGRRVEIDQEVAGVLQNVGGMIGMGQIGLVPGKEPQAIDQSRGMAEEKQNHHRKDHQGTLELFALPSTVSHVFHLLSGVVYRSYDLSVKDSQDNAWDKVDNEGVDNSIHHYIVDFALSQTCGIDKRLISVVKKSMFKIPHNIGPKGYHRNANHAQPSVLKPYQPSEGLTDRCVALNTYQCYDPN